MVIWRTRVWWLCVIWWSHDMSSGWSGAQRLLEVSPAWGESPPDSHREKRRTLMECHPPTGTDQLVSMTTGMSESWFCWWTWTWTRISPIRSLHYETSVYDAVRDIVCGSQLINLKTNCFFHDFFVSGAESLSTRVLEEVVRHSWQSCETLIKCDW